MHYIYDKNTLKGAPASHYAYNGSAMPKSKWTKSAYVDAAEWNNFTSDHVKYILSTPSAVLFNLVLRYQGDERNSRHGKLFMVFDLAEEEEIDWEDLKKHANLKEAEYEEFTRIKNFIRHHDLFKFSADGQNLIATIYWNGEKFADLLPLHFFQVSEALKAAKGYQKWKKQHLTAEN